MGEGSTALSILPHPGLPRKEGGENLHVTGHYEAARRVFMLYFPQAPDGGRYIMVKRLLG